MAHMTQEELQRWESIRVIGRQQYILRYGVLGIGLIIGICAALLEILLAQFSAASFTDFSGTFNDELIARLAFYAFIFAVLGYVYGRWTWSVMEARYQDTRQRERG